MRFTPGFLPLALLCCLFVSASSQRRMNALQLLARMNPEVLATLGSREAEYPERPKVFNSPEELRHYLEELNIFYAITGRPRFGKRSGTKQPSAPFEDKTDSEPYHF